VLNGPIRRYLKQPAAWIIGTTQRAGLHRFETAERGRASEQSNVRPLAPEALPMLMNVSEEHRPQGAMGTQQLLKTSLIEKPNRIHAGIADGDRWMVERDHKGQITTLRTLEALLQPTELTRAELTCS